MKYNPTPLDTSPDSKQLIYEGGNLINQNFQEILVWMNKKQAEIDDLKEKNKQQDIEIKDLQIKTQEQQNTTPNPFEVGAFAIAINLLDQDINYNNLVDGVNLCPANGYTVVNKIKDFDFDNIDDERYETRLDGRWVSMTVNIPPKRTTEIEENGETKYVHTWSAGLFMRVE